jgi:hypothetical protein
MMGQTRRHDRRLRVGSVSDSGGASSGAFATAAEGDTDRTLTVRLTTDTHRAVAHDVEQSIAACCLVYD